VRPSRALVAAVAVCLVTPFASFVTERRAVALEPPPPPPWHPGPDVDGTLGVYAPFGRLKRVTAPGEWMRVTAGYEITSWLGLFGAFDAAFLATNRANPPPGERGYVLWGFGGGARLSLPIGTRWRIPLRVEVGAHKAEDNGVLATYGFPNAKSFGLSYGAMLGVEWRATSRHFGIAVEFGLRNDSSLKDVNATSAPLAMLGGLLVRYTL